MSNHVLLAQKHGPSTRWSKTTAAVASRRVGKSTCWCPGKQRKQWQDSSRVCRFQYVIPCRCCVEFVGLFPNNLMYPFCGVCKLWEVPLLRSVNRCHSDLEHGSSTSMAETTQFAAIILPVQNASCRLFLGNFEVSNLNTHLCKRHGLFLKKQCNPSKT